MKRGWMLVIAVGLLAIAWPVFRTHWLSRGAAEQGTEPSRGSARAHLVATNAAGKPSGSAAIDDAETRDAPTGTPRLERQLTAEDGSIAVLVTREGRPLPAAEVRLYFQGVRDPNTDKFDWRVAATGLTSEEGIFATLAMPGAYLVVAQSAGVAPGRAELRHRRGQSLSRVTIALQPGVELAGQTLIKTSGAAVAMADIRISSALGPRANSPVEEYTQTRSDAHGHFRFANLSPGRYRLEATAPTFARVVMSTVDAPVPDLKVSFSAAATLAGYVLETDGRGVAGATVTAVGRRDPITATTGSNGGFTLDVSPDTYSLSARLADRAGAIREPISLAAGQTRDALTIQLADSARIEGVVTANKDGTPLGGVLVAASPHNRTGDNGSIVTDGGGNFSLGGLPAGSYDVVFTLDNYSPDRELGVVVSDGQRFPLNVKLLGTASVSGVVRNANGQGVAGASVDAGNRQSDVASGAATVAETDSSGAYALSGLATGAAFLTAKGQGSNGGQVKKTTLVEGQSELDFVLSETATVSGMVTGKDGRPPQSAAKVRAAPSGSVASLSRVEADVGADGSYSLQLPIGGYSLLAWLSNGAGAYGFPTNSVTLAAGQDQTVNLTLGNDGVGDISGTVTEPTGQPSSGAFVSVFAGQQRWSGTTGEDGTFSFSNLPPMPPDGYRLNARNGGRQALLIVTTQSAEPVQLQLSAGCTITGSVKDSTGTAVQTYSVWTQPASIKNQMKMGALRFFGDSFELDDVGAGDLRIIAVTDDGRSGEADATLNSGASVQVQITLSNKPQ